ncbi:chloride channel CLC-b [Olea europaea subsp. europaea]|uniref:Chloride channel CLC-b n=1 Tax=Olea europaea subsp. europaea TaxID=158383 RepID=A0A8S0TIJ7_OLEEU|nr:chloride channel CLC-b [Olea europaea subsp. europaea]
MLGIAMGPYTKIDQGLYAVLGATSLMAGSMRMIVSLRGLPFLDARPEPQMRNITVGELADVKPTVVTLSCIEKVGRIVEVLKNTTHNGFPVVDEGVVPPMGLPNGVAELHGLIIRAYRI